MVEKNQYDITVDAVVTDIKNKLDGIYRVKTDGAEFDAYATAGTYYKDDRVLVQIPNGNYGNQKFILGRKVDESVANQTFNFKLPFDDFIGLKHLNDEPLSGGQYWANYPGFAKENAPTGRIDENNNPIIENPTFVWKWENPGFSTIGNTRLGIQADWQVLLGHYQPLRGTYGFRIITKGTASTTDTSSETQVQQEDYFTNRDMYGNTYAFFVPYTQQKVIDVTKFLEIESIEIHFYQDYNFADANNSYISYKDYDNNGRPAEPENILFDALDVYLGVSNEDLSEETVKLFSYDPLSYTGIEHKPEQAGDVTTWTCEDERTLQCAWIHKEENKMFSVIDALDELLKQGESSGKDTHVYWYRRNYEEITGTAESLFPGQLFIKNADGTYSPVYHEETGKPVFDPDVQRAEEYRDLFLDLEHEKDNPAYEARITRYGGDGWTFIPAATDKFEYTFKPRGNRSREKFKVVVQHHGTHTSSEEIVLKNTRDVEAEAANGARNDALILQTYKVIKEKNDDEWSGNYLASKDNSMNAFHVYDENNKVLYNDDDERYDEHYYYLQVHFRNEDTYEYETLQTVAENGLSVGTTVSWSMPQDYTMIKSSMAVNAEDAKLFGIDATNEPVRYQNFCNATIKFQIKETLNNRAQNNTVNAIIVRNNDTHHIEKVLDFGRADGQGHEFAPIVEVIEPAGGSYICQNEEFQIGVAVYNRDGSLFSNPELLSFTWTEIGKESSFINYGRNNELETAADGYLIDKYYYTDESYNQATFDKYRGYSNNVIRGRLINDAPPVFEVKVYGAGDYPLVARFAPMVCNNYEYKQQRDIMIPSRIEFKSDGTNPIFYNEYFTIDVMDVGEDLLISHLAEWPEWQLNEKGQKLFHLESAKVKQNTVETTTAEDGTETTAPVEREYTKYRLRSNAEFTDDNGVKQDRLQWSENLLKQDYYSYIYFRDNDKYVAQAFAFARNYYASSLVNDWNGVSLTWDEENGAVLSTMIAAGSKDSENRFTGVMMGDWGSKGDESLDTPGMYGYHQGEQSFGFKTDGTGFIGKSGKGRIQFDGNEAIISNADRSCYINLNPISLKESPSAMGNQSFSSNFLYCEVPRSNNSFTSLSDGILGINSWVREYFQNNSKDYFIVDPNHGVLTTGGIVARYGALGNWMISDEGMYQKSSEARAYMYLGFDQRNISTSSEWNNRKRNAKKAQEDLEANYDALETYDRQIASAEAEVTTAQTNLDNANDAAKTLKLEQEALIAGYEAEIVNLEKEIDELEKENKDYQEQIKQKETDKGNLLKRKSELSELYNNKQVTHSEKVQQLKDLDNENAVALADAQADYAFVSTQKTDLEDYRNEILLLQTEYNNCLTNREELNILIAQLDTTITNLTEEVNVEYQKVSELADQQNALTISIDTLNSTIDVTETSIKLSMLDVYTAEESKIVKTTVQYEADKTNLNTQLTECETQITTLTTNISELASQIEELVNSNEDGNNDKQITELTTHKLELETSLNEKQTRKTELENDISVLEDIIIPKSQQLDTYKTTLAEKEAQLEAFVAEHATALGTYNAKNDSLNVNKEIRKSYIEDLEDNYKEIEQIEQSLFNLENSINILNETLIQYEEKYTLTDIKAYPEQENTNNDVIEDIANLLSELLGEAGKYNNLIKRISDTLNMIQKVIDDLEIATKQDPTVVKLNKEIATLLEEMESIAEELRGINGENGLVAIDASILTLQNEITFNDNLIAEKNIQIYGDAENDLADGWIEQINAAQNQISMSNTNIQNLTQIKSDKVAVVESLTMEKTKVTININKLIASLIDLQQTIKAINSEFTVTRDIVKDNYVTIVATIKSAIDAIMTSDTTRYAIYVADSEPLSWIADYNSMIKPYFSVDWSGTMFARKGLIANTWIIDDTSLTYQKNNDKIFLGQGDQNDGRVYEKNSENNLIISYPTAQNEINGGWDISAGVIETPANAESYYDVRFGVTANGRLYSEYGRIGGWDIEKTTLSSTPSSTGNKIIFDAGNNKIQFSNGAFVVDGNKGTVFLGQMSEDGSLMRGNVYLAEFKLSGQSAIGDDNEGIGYAQNVINASNQNTADTTIGGISEDFGWGGVSASGTTIGVTTNKLVKNLNFKLDPAKTNYLQFFDASESPNHKQYGVVLAVGNRSGENADSVDMIFYPKKDGGILGLDKYRWNLVANNITSRIIEADTGCIKQPYMIEESSSDPSTIKLIASQWWVTEQLKKIWDALEDVSGSAAKASQNSWARSIVAAKFITHADGANVRLTMQFTRGNGATFDSKASTPLASGFHGHNIRVIKQGAGIWIDVPQNSACGGGANVGNFSMQHGHTLEGSFSEGTFTIELGLANFDSPSSQSYTYDVTGTSWYKKKAYGGYRHTKGYVYINSLGGTLLATVDYTSVLNAEYTRGYNAGKSDGYNDGYAAGREKGFREGVNSIKNQTEK